MMEADEYINSKNYLMKASSETGKNVYNELSEIIRWLLSKRPSNACDVLLNTIKSLQSKQFKYTDDVSISKYEDNQRSASLARMFKKLFEIDEDVEALEASNLADADLDSPNPNLFDLFSLLQQADLGLGEQEMTLINLSLKKLVDQRPAIESVRFWGKIFGTEKDYLIAEVDFRDGEEEEDEDTGDSTAMTTTDLQQVEETEDGEESDEEGKRKKEEELPKSNYKPAPTAPTEATKSGANLKSFFVCNDPAEEWVKLPSVTPTQIVVARQIHKFFTGRLDAQVVSYPPFPGVEKNLLRAQLSRISAACHISPVGFFQFDEDEEEEEDAAHRTFVPNPEFEGIQVKELVDPSMANWVHHVLYILPQGRTIWWNPVSKGDADAEEAEDDDEEKEVTEGQQPEVGPPLLTPLSEDAEIGGLRPWSTRVSTRLLPKQAIAVVSSNFWPGAHAIANNRMHENIYIGWGLKCSGPYNPPVPNHIFTEYLPTQELEEMEDPTPEQEKALNMSGDAVVDEIGEGERQDDEANDEEDDDDY